MDSGLIGQTAENSTTCEDAGKGIKMYTLYAPLIWHIEHVAYLCICIYIYTCDYVCVRVQPRSKHHRSVEGERCYLHKKDVENSGTSVYF